MWHRPVCVKCNREMRPEKNGVGCLDVFEDGRTYQLWDSDLWKCPECGYEILEGFGRGCLAEHYQDNFKSFLEAWQKDGLVIEARR